MLKKSCEAASCCQLASCYSSLDAASSLLSTSCQLFNLSSLPAVSTCFSQLGTLYKPHSIPSKLCFLSLLFSTYTLDLAHHNCKDDQGEITTISTRSVLPAVATPSCLLRQACPQAWAAPAWSSFTGISWATWSWSSPRLTRARRTWGRWSTRSYPTARGSGPTSRRRGSREWGRGERRSKWITLSCSLQLPFDVAVSHSPVKSSQLPQSWLYTICCCCYT